MATNTSQTPQTWLPEQTGNLVLQPVQADSVAVQAIGGAIFASPQTHGYRVPVIAGDPTADWTAEGEEIDVSEAVLDEEHDVFHKLAGYSVISRELADDSAPGVAEQIGAGLARDIARKIDLAFFGTRGASTLPPRGLEDLDGVTEHDAGEAWADGDPFTAAVYAAESVGARINAFVAHPDDALALAQLKQTSESNVPLLGTSATEATQRLISGVQLLASPAITPGVVWGLPTNDRVHVVIREDVRIERDSSAFFTSDRIAIRATLRATSLFPHEAAIQKITLENGS